MTGDNNPEPDDSNVRVPLCTREDIVRPTLSTFRALRHRNFLLFWSGQLISLIGTWMQAVAQSWLVKDLAVQQYGIHEASKYLGLIAALGSAPMFIFTLLAGVIADRADKRRILIATQSSAALLALALGLLVHTGHITLWQVAIFALMLGVVNAFDMPTRQSFIKDMVGPEDLTNAIALNSSIFNGARIIGPAIAGVLISIPFFGISGAFYANAVSYLAVIAGLVAIRLLPQVNHNIRGDIWLHMKEGISYAFRHRIIRLNLVMMAVFSVFSFSYIILMPIIAQTLGLDARGFGILLTVGGIGALAGALILASSSGRICKGPLLLMGGMVSSVALIIMSFSHSAYLTGAMLILTSGGLVIATSAINSIIQETTPDHYRGRVVSIWTFIFAGFAPIGALYAGYVANLTSPGIAILIGALCCLLTLAFVFARAPWFWRLP